MSGVSFQYTQFMDLNIHKKQGEVKYGYRIYDEYGQYCNDNYNWEDLIKIDAEEAVMIIENEYNDLYELILDNGFNFNGEWVSVDETGIVIQEEV